MRQLGRVRARCPNDCPFPHVPGGVSRPAAAHRDITVIVWVGTFIYAYLGSDSAVGRNLISIGFGFSNSPVIAYALGAVIVVGLIYLLGLHVESRLETRVRHLIDSLMERIPLSAISTMAPSALSPSWTERTRTVSRA